MFTRITSLLHLLLLGLESYILVRSDICFFYKHIILLPYAVSQILLFPEKLNSVCLHLSSKTNFSATFLPDSSSFYVSFGLPFSI